MDYLHADAAAAVGRFYHKRQANALGGGGNRLAVVGGNFFAGQHGNAEFGHFAARRPLVGHKARHVGGRPYESDAAAGAFGGERGGFG